MIGGLLTIAAPGLPGSSGEAVKPGDPVTGGFGAVLARALPPAAEMVLPPPAGESPARPVDLPLVDPEAKVEMAEVPGEPTAVMPVPPPGPAAPRALPIALTGVGAADGAVGRSPAVDRAGGPVPVVTRDAGLADAVAERRSFGRHDAALQRAVVANAPATLWAPRSMPAQGVGVPSVGAWPPATELVAEWPLEKHDPTAVAEAIAPPVGTPQPLPVVLTGGAEPAAVVKVPEREAPRPVLPVAAPTVTRAPEWQAPVGAAVAAIAPVVVAAPMVTQRTPDFPGLPLKPEGDRPFFDRAPGADLAAGPGDAGLSVPVIEIGRRDARAVPGGAVTEFARTAQRFEVVPAVAPSVASAVPGGRDDGGRRDFDAVSAGDGVVSSGGSVVLPGVSGGNPLVRAGVADASAPATVVAQRISVESETLGPVDIGVDGSGQDLRVRFSAGSAAAGVMAAEAPRLLADLAAQGVRVQALAFDGHVEPSAETAAGAGSGAAGRETLPQDLSGQAGGQPGSARRPFGAPPALPVEALTEPARARPRISERYA